MGGFSVSFTHQHQSESSGSFEDLFTFLLHFSEFSQSQLLRTITMQPEPKPAQEASNAEPHPSAITTVAKINAKPIDRADSGSNSEIEEIPRPSLSDSDSDIEEIPRSPSPTLTSNTKYEFTREPDGTEVVTRTNVISVSNTPDDTSLPTVAAKLNSVQVTAVNAFVLEARFDFGEESDEDARSDSEDRDGVSCASCVSDTSCVHCVEVLSDSEGETEGDTEETEAGAEERKVEVKPKLAGENAQKSSLVRKSEVVKH
ncbi:hypothetical protein BJ508DRAFT_316160 [Ascobolus immersus RN42]|uniref:Uncharacterized protein n=1 Tax=Ascobolus immersus RN42 TaxID=1160509 RepID=A0A3N4H7L3_ASCIM|nr:hypothetical protein BJ508DRAFT_316160 [Ascobolus immersus RN42]